MTATALPGVDWPQVAQPGAGSHHDSASPAETQAGVKNAGDNIPPDFTSPVLLVVDGPSLAHRAYHAYGRPGTASMVDPTGRPIWAVYGFLKLLLGIIDRTDPDAIVVGFDDRTASVRREAYPEYKAGRGEKSDDLYAQLDQLPGLLVDLGVAVVVPAGLEADDVLATAAWSAEAVGWRCVVATSDKDSFGLISDRVTVLRLMSGLDNAVMMTPAALLEQYGLTPAQWPDYQALAGDASDNLPGVPGIGTKTAVKLLAECGTLDAAIADPAAARKAIKGYAAKLTAPGAAEAIALHRRITAPQPAGQIVPVRCRPAATGGQIVKALRRHHLPSLIDRAVAALSTAEALEDTPPPARPAPDTQVCSTPECVALIRMVWMESGGRMPVDADPNPAGNLAWAKSDLGWRMVVLADGQEPTDGRRWMSHFATCARPQDHRRPRRRHLGVVDQQTAAAAGALAELGAEPIAVATAPVQHRRGDVSVRAETRPCCTPGHDDGRPARLYPGGVFCDPCIDHQRAARGKGTSR